jgi:deoxycytidine triphosphate deaminase
MILSDGEIGQALNERLITIEPRPSAERYKGSAVDLTLGSELWRLLVRPNSKLMNHRE